MPSVDVVSGLFFSVTCFVLWWMVLGYALPAGLGVFRLAGNHRWPTRVRVLLILVLLLSVGVVASKANWRWPKPHDDRWALSNVRLLALRRFDTEDLFFRSRVRPGFVALMLPLQAGLSYDLEVVSYTYSDSIQRLFYTFDRPGGGLGRVYPEATLVSLVLAALGILIVGRLVLAFPGGRLSIWRGLLAVVMAGWLFRRILGTGLVSPITLSATWAVYLLAGLAFVGAMRVPAVRIRWVGAGVAMGLAFLFKESAVALVLTVLAFQVFLVFRDRSFRRAGVVSCLVYWVAASFLPLVYFGTVLGGGLREIPANFAQHLQSESLLTGYLQGGTLSGILGALWAAFGVSIGLMLGGLMRAAIRPTRGDMFFLFWLLGASLPLFLPYLYPRFLVYMVPGVVWFACRLIDVVGDGRRIGHGVG
ncbi:hypothetical protein HQ520_02280 [bacterium]|nr:hypothetical protein [bacterium]